MYRKILVPLDGSAFAEQVLPHVKSLVESGHEPAHVYLVLVVPMLPDLSAAMVTLYPFYLSRAYAGPLSCEIMEAEHSLREYLRTTCQQVAEWGAVAHWELRRGSPAEEIVAMAASIEADVIVMSTHGRSGMTRWVYGSVADKILQGSTVPVLLVRADTAPVLEG